MDEVRKLRCDDHQGTERRPPDCVLCKRIYHRNYYHASNRKIKLRSVEKKVYIPKNNSVKRKQRKSIRPGCDEHGEYAQTKTCTMCKSIYMVHYFNNNRERMLEQSRESHKRNYVKRVKKVKPEKKKVEEISEPNEN